MPVFGEESALGLALVLFSMSMKVHFT